MANAALIAPLALIGGGLALYAAVIVLTGRWSHETQGYTLLRKVGDMELRRVQSSVVAQVHVAEADARRAGNAGFRPLARYIFGGNTRRGGRAQGGAESIPMTTPVVFHPHQASGAAGGGAHSVAFVMPRKYTAGGAAGMPLPNDAGVALEDVPARYELVSTRRGRWPSQAEGEAWYASTVAAAVAAGLRPLASEAGWRGVVLRRYSYDPPFIPDVLKKTEVAVEVEAPDA